LSADRRGGQRLAHLLAGGGADEADSASAQDVQAEVTAAFDPLVVLLGQDRADQTDEAVAVGEDPDDVGPSADLAVEAFL
jgi:hypothetical protein